MQAQVVPVAQRLTVSGVFGDASVEVKLICLMLLAAAAFALASWGMSLRAIGQGDLRGLGQGLGRLRMIRSAGVMLGGVAVAWICLCASMGVANVQPADLKVLAPAFAEAFLAIGLGLTASTVALICERHLEGRISPA